MTRTYSKFECFVCGKEISCNGLAKTAHFRKHVQEGILIEDRNYEWFGFRLEYRRLGFDFTERGREIARERYG